MSYVLSGVVAERETLAMAEGLVVVPRSEGMARGAGGATRFSRRAGASAGGR
jgi:hypothetical protein